MYEFASFSVDHCIFWNVVFIMCCHSFYINSLEGDLLLLSINHMLEVWSKPRSMRKDSSRIRALNPQQSESLSAVWPEGWGGVSCSLMNGWGLRSTKNELLKCQCATLKHQNSLWDLLSTHGWMLLDVYTYVSKDKFSEEFKVLTDCMGFRRCEETTSSL